MTTPSPLNRWADSPAAFVRDLFGVTPDPWQTDVLDAFPHHQRLAMKACKGPGKTAVMAWLAWNFLLTRDEPKVAATSITADNLADNLWSEMAKWRNKSALLRDLFGVHVEPHRRPRPAGQHPRRPPRRSHPVPAR